MRLHHLEATAFGPFAGTVRVDFDDLSAAGLFLLTGPTGAGKTSVLDAVCFALYGDVPGDRSTARSLRSDHAEAGRAPRVRLECTLAGRRFRLDRSPAWRRPKKRGAGTTPEQARVTLTERRGGRWEPVSTRIDEVGQLVGDLLGMTLGQFTQVALLPQGDFQAFLRAGADSRQRLLERLFSTARFREVEEWVAQHRRQLHRASQQQGQRVAELLARVAEVAGVEAPREWADEGLAEVAGDGTVRSWVRRRHAEARAEAERTTLAHREAAAAAATAEVALAQGRELASRQRRHGRAQAELVQLRGLDDAQRDRRERLHASRRVSPVLVLLDREERLTGRHAAARTAAAATRAEALTLLPESDGPHGDPHPQQDPTEAGPDLEQARDQAAARAARIAAALPREREGEGLRRAVAQDGETLLALHTELSELDARTAQLPELVAQATGRCDEASTAASRLEGEEERVAGLRRRLEAARRVVALSEQRTEAVGARHTAVDRVQAATEAWLEVRQRRLAGMAAEIAGRLAVGDECPVCGSAEHPAPASAAPDAPDAAAEREARRRVDDAELIRESAADHERGLAQSLAVAAEVAGGADVEELERAESEAVAQMAATRTLASDLPDARRLLAERADELEGHRRRLAELRERVEAIAATQASREEQIAGVERELDELREGADAPLSAPLAGLLARAEATATACGRALTATAELVRADRELVEATARADKALAEAGVDSRRAAREAALDPEQSEALEREVRAHDDRMAAVSAILAEPELCEAAEMPVPDLDALVLADEHARASLTEATHADRAAGDRAERLEALDRRVGAVLEEWEPLREQHATAAGLAALVEGKSADNRLQMRLSAYVLSYRLGQVVDAANERLARMSDQRYLLEHSGTRGAGDRRGGLGLRVNDAWSGSTRDPATLSGGETFVVSLALALGLADVVGRESGGAHLDTLFVDEGFGSLDPETLEDVMATLDSLRSGGRVVGVVSHVAEMRDRIAARVVVAKSPSGSTLTQVSG